MTAEEAISYLLEKRQSDFHPAPDRMTRLMERLGDPQKKLRFVHVAGTNGKGSTSCLIASALTAAGYRTGLYTSPHLSHFSERIRVGDEPIPNEEIARLAGQVRRAEESLSVPVAAFDRMTAAAFLWFLECGCEIVVLEVGLGGLLDATNVIDRAEVSVITNIGLDHTEVLGAAVAQIAAQKAGIVKPGCPVVLYPQTAEAEAAVRRACEEKNAPLYRADFSALRVLRREIDKTVFSWGNSEPITLGLAGEYQLKNAAAALTAISVLRERGFSVSDAAVQAGFARAKWPGRFELLRRSPVFLLDGGHNPQCAEALCENLKTAFPEKSFVFLLGMMADKDVGAVLDILVPVMRAAVTVPVQNPRAMPAERLAALLREKGVLAEAAETLSLGAARADALAAGEGVCAFGSLYLAGAVRSLFSL